MFRVHRHVPDHGCHVPAALLYTQVEKKRGGAWTHQKNKKNINIVKKGIDVIK